MAGRNIIIVIPDECAMPAIYWYRSRIHNLHALTLFNTLYLYVYASKPTYSCSHSVKLQWNPNVRHSRIACELYCLPTTATLQCATKQSSLPQSLFWCWSAIKSDILHPKQDARTILNLKIAHTKRNSNKSDGILATNLFSGSLSVP